MATIKSYTDLQQSKKLAEILPLESADMCYRIVAYNPDDTHVYQPYCFVGTLESDIPCWSLASLLEQLPYELCDDDDNSCYLQINKENDMYQLAYEDPYGNFESIETDRYEHFVDACYELILKLHELNLL